MCEERATTWDQLMDFLYENAWTPSLRRFRPPFVFRGMADVAFLLDTSLMRLGEGYQHSERHLLRNFKKYALRNVIERDSFWYWLSVAQHHGLPTRLMDWTFSPYVALHFVTTSLELYDRDGVVWCLDYQKAHQQLPPPLKQLLADEGADLFTVDMLSHIPSLDAFDKLADEPFALFLEPPSIDDRIINQYALFSVVSNPTVSLNQWLETRPDMYRKLVIDHQLKWEIRDKLDQANINERVLFPGLDGLSQWLRRQYVQADCHQPIDDYQNRFTRH
ncbi:FRG domain-containing protein [Spirosoma linguale]|uniref:FRG domain protein n=1 Tax=Spirosoma linguale (strain ATCC 33905 / DSM 74 / LMG 10896 / Claus 1) TaxID=504472 RepID=D2QJV0_SPILD|nr:FRG domain protein [Spirosoma linguale DSM 74]